MSAVINHIWSRTRMCEVFQGGFAASRVKSSGLPESERTCKHYFIPENKAQYEREIASGDYLSEKAKSVPSAQQVIPTLFLGLTNNNLHYFFLSIKLLQVHIMCL